MTHLMEKGGNEEQGGKGEKKKHRSERGEARRTTRYKRVEERERERRTRKTDGKNSGCALVIPLSGCCSYPRRSVSYPRLALNPGCASPNETQRSPLSPLLYQVNLDSASTRCTSLVTESDGLHTYRARGGEFKTSCAGTTHVDFFFFFFFFFVSKLQYFLSFKYVEV